MIEPTPTTRGLWTNPAPHAAPSREPTGHYAIFGSTDLIICPKCGGTHMRLMDCQQVGRITLTPNQQGCICPPGANLTCQAPLCPRKPISGAAR
jgi:hypothetical protein